MSSVDERINKLKKRIEIMKEKNRQNIKDKKFEQVKKDVKNNIEKVLSGEMEFMVLPNLEKYHWNLFLNEQELHKNGLKISECKINKKSDENPERNALLWNLLERYLYYYDSDYNDFFLCKTYPMKSSNYDKNGEELIDVVFEIEYLEKC